MQMCASTHLYICIGGHGSKCTFMKETRMQTPGVTTIVTIKSKVPNSPETVPIYRYIHDDMSTQIPHASIDTSENVHQR